MAEFIEGKEQAVNKGDPIIFENKTGSAFDVSVGIVFHKSGIYEVSIAENRTVVSKITTPTTAPEIIHCKYCKHFEYDHFENVCGIPLIVAHEICMRWGDGVKTREDGYCFLAERKEDG